MSFDVLVCVHNYTEMENGKPGAAVRSDRIARAREVVSEYDSIGASVQVLFLGARTTDGAHPLYAVASTEAPALIEAYSWVVVDSYCGDTRSEIASVTEYVAEAPWTPEFVVSVSSTDHVARIQRLWAEARQTRVDDASYITTTVASDGTYSEADRSPFILEPARFEAFLSPFSRVLNISPEQHEAAAAEVSRVLGKYE
jgi:hypothetical protein